MTRIEINENHIDREFIARQLHYLSSIGYFQVHCKKHVNQASIASKVLAESVPILVPPKNEQKRIVTKIKELQTRSSRAREALETVPDLLEQLRQSILAAAFRGDLTKAWRRKQGKKVEPASELLKRIRVERRKRWEEAELAKLKAKGLAGEKLDTAFAKQRKRYKEPAPVNTSGLPELPEGWCWCWLADMGYMNRGKSKHRPRNAKHLYGGKYPFIQTGDISKSNGRITQHSQTYSKSGLAQSKIWPKGTICITIAANIANSAILTYPACFPDSVVGIVPDFCPSEYIEFFIRTARDGLEKFAPATAQKNINIGILNNVIMPLAPKKEIDEIVRIIESTFLFAETTEEKWNGMQDKLEHIERSIFSKAFRGELVSQDPDDEPASILFERIRQEKARQAEAQKAKPKQKGKKMKRPKTKQQDIVTILQEASGAMTPEELFYTGGFGEDTVDAFYEQLRDAVTSKKVRETRKDHEVRLEAMK